MAEPIEGKIIPGFHRGIECSAVTIDDHGNPVFAFRCDCATTTAVTVADLAEKSATLEFAFTCDGCGTAHWMTIARVDRES